MIHFRYIGIGAIGLLAFLGLSAVIGGHFGRCLCIKPFLW